MQTFRHPPYKPLWDKRVEAISGRCFFVLEQQGFSLKECQRFVSAMARWFRQTKPTMGDVKDSQDYSSPYTRPVSKTMWDERFDLTTSIANQPVTKQFLKLIGSRRELPDHRFYGYVAALALLQIMRGLLATKPDDLDAFVNFGGPYEEGEPDYTALEIEEEQNTMLENILGKAEEFVVKTDVLTGQAELGFISRRPPDKSWEPRIEEEIKRMGSGINAFRFRSGKKVGMVNVTQLADHLHTKIRSDMDNQCPRNFPKNAKTLARRFPEILTRLEIRDK